VINEINRKIAIDARYLNRPGMGFYVYLMNLIEALREVEGIDITFLVDRVPNDFQINKNEHIIVLKQYVIDSSWAQYSLATHLLKSKYDIIISPCNFGVPLILNKKGAKYVTIVHDLIPIQIPSYIFRRRRYAIPFYLFVPISIYKSDLIITGSNYSARSIKKIFHRKAEVCYPPLSYLPINVSKSKKIIRDKYQINSNKYFIYTGGYDPRKNVANMLNAFKTFSLVHKEYSFVLTGKIPEKYLKVIGGFSPNKIIKVGYVPEEDKNSLIKNAAALVNGSSMEGFGLPVIEAFRLGTPVITTTNSSLSEVVNNAGVHILNNSMASILDAMNVFSELDDDELERQIDLGYKQLERLNKTQPRANLVRLIMS
jgi:glycosyltransferase involved in cell wall biosynthesis